jgi:exodeoxyribonuclease III
MRFSVATWNINSVRLRLPLVKRFLKRYAPDVLCLQETKCPDDQFPRKQFAEIGYPHVEIYGQKGYHGVATVSRHPLENAEREKFCRKDDCRHLSVELGAAAGLARPITIHNFYVPAGGDEPNPEINEKFAHKLAFLDELAAHAISQDAKKGARSILVGDLNVAPLEHDVWSHKQLLNVVSHTPVEVEKFRVFQQAGGWIDVMRGFIPASEKLYTWWSYRAANWEESDRGRRLDHIWASPALRDTAREMNVIRNARSWKQPSDHVPVMVVFDF